MAFRLQPDCLDDLAYAIMYETTKLAYRVSEEDVTRARNQVAKIICLTFDYPSLIFIFIGKVKPMILTFSSEVTNI